MRFLPTLLLCLPGAACFALDSYPASPDAAKAEIEQICQNPAVDRCLNSPDVWLHASERQTLPADIIPTLRRLVALNESLLSDPTSKADAQQFDTFLYPLLALLGDQQTLDRLQHDPAPSAALALLQARWWQGAQDPAAQDTVLRECRDLAHRHPDDADLAQGFLTLADIGPATRNLRDGMLTVVTHALHPQATAAVAKHIAALKTRFRPEGSPLVLSGRTDNGQSFTTADWKGKVILVDFWATWCHPCMMEAPRTAQVYARYHQAGLEVIGVSCDRSAGALAQFHTRHPEMPWPQLFDPAKPGWNPLAGRCGIDGIPTLFLIDRAGVVRSVSARYNMDALIPQLLAEQ